MIDKHHKDALKFTPEETIQDWRVAVPIGNVAGFILHPLSWLLNHFDHICLVLKFVIENVVLIFNVHSLKGHVKLVLTLNVTIENVMTIVSWNETHLRSESKIHETKTGIEFLRQFIKHRLRYQNSFYFFDVTNILF